LFQISKKNFERKEDYRTESFLEALSISQDRKYCFRDVPTRLPREREKREEEEEERERRERKKNPRSENF